MHVYNPATSPRTPTEIRIWAALQTPPNVIAGRPNAGNLTLPLIQRYGTLPPAVFLDYTRRALETFVPGLQFTLTLKEAPANHESWQAVEVAYSQELVTSG